MQSPIPDDWNGEDTCRWAVCWPDSPKWKAILLGLIEMPMQGRFWDFSTGSFLALRGDFRPIYDYNFDLRSVIMACNDTGLTDVAVALTQMANSVNNISLAITQQLNNACCEKQGSGGAGTSQPPFDPTTPGNPQQDPPPDGYESWEEFLNDKCAISHGIVTRLKSDLGNLAILQFSTFDVGALAALIAVIIATPVPFDDLLALAGLLLSIAATIVITSTLDIINTNEEDFICVLYNSQNSAAAAADFNTLFGGLADTYFSDPVEKFASKAIINYFIDASVTNELFVKNTAVQYPQTDCSGCTEGCVTEEWWVQWGSVVSDDLVNNQRIMDIDSVNNGTYYQIVVFTYPQGGSPTCAVSMADITTDCPGIGLPYAGEADAQHHLGLIFDAPGNNVVYFKSVEELLAFDNFYAIALDGNSAGWGAEMIFDNA